MVYVISALIDGLEYIYDVKDASKLQANGFLLSYLILNKRYANLFLDGNTYQSCQVSLEPITLIILNRLVAEIPENTLFEFRSNFRI